MNSCKFITLDNGLTILIYSDKSKITNYAMLITFLGGLNEKFISYTGKEKKIYKGTAHLLEHYVCENTSSGNLIDNLLENKALGANASTNSSETSFYFSTVYNFEDNLELLLNSVYNPIFNSNNLAKTKYAVLNEIRDEKDDFQRKVIYTKVSNIFNNFNRTLGNKTSVNNVSIKYLKEVYDNFYVPKNQFLVVAGNFEEEKILNLIKNIYKKFNFKCNKKAIPLTNQKEVVKKESAIKGNSLNEVIISFKIDVNKLNSYDRYKFDWYLNYFIDINFSRFSDLNKELKDTNIITGDITSCVYNRSGYTVLEVLAYTSKGKEFKDLVMSSIKNFKSNKEYDFELSKKSSITNISVRKDNISNYVLPIVDNYVEFNYPHDDTIDFISNLNFDEYIKTISNINFNNYSILIVKGNNNK